MVNNLKKLIKNWTEYVVPQWDMKYSDFDFQSKSWATITLDLSTTITPTADFTINPPSTIEDWQEYILRVNNWSTAYTMTLWRWINNSWNVNLTLNPNRIDQFVFLGIDWWLELQPEVVLSVNGNSWAVTVNEVPSWWTTWQVLTKTDSGSEWANATGWVTSVNGQTWAVTLDADDISDSSTTNKFVTASDKTTWSWKQDALVSWTNIKTINSQSILWSGNLSITAGVLSVNGETGTVVLDADDISDSSTTNKFVTDANKTTWNWKQDALVSGTNIKTINSTSILWSGNIDTNQVSDTAYGSWWNWVTSTAPSQNAVYDKISSMDTTISNKANTSDVLVKTNTTEFTPTWSYQPATKKYVDDNISAATWWAVSDEAFSASWDWVTWIAPSKNTVYDKISSMDTTISWKAPWFSLKLSHAVAWNPREVNFITIDYWSMEQYDAAYFKLSATSCHPNGSSYAYLVDIIIGCTYTWAVSCKEVKYVHTNDNLSSYDNWKRYFWDVFYVNDTTNKKIYFYILWWAWTSSNFTPVIRIWSTSLEFVTQHTWTATYYSSWTKVWANWCWTLYALENEIPTKTSQITNDSWFLSNTSSSTWWLGIIWGADSYWTWVWNSSYAASYWTALWYNARSNWQMWVAIGRASSVWQQGWTSIGALSGTNAVWAIQLWALWTNTETGTLYVSLWDAWDTSRFHNYKLLWLDWKIPIDRLQSVISDVAYANSWNWVTDIAPSKNAVYDKINAMDTTISWKQATLVSGTNIKTVNSTSLLWSGNIAVQPTLVSWTNIKTVNWESLLWSGNITAWTDYSWVTKTISSGNVEIWLRTIIEPTANFTLTAPSTLKDWEEYVIRCVNTTSYTITLWTWFTNPRSVSLTLSQNATDQFVFIAIGWELELQPLVATWS